jgi:hypothetical protein
VAVVVQTIALACPSLATALALVPSVAVLDTSSGLLHDWVTGSVPPWLLFGELHWLKAGTSGTRSGEAPDGRG